ncbi:DUF4900 domain-containing protein [Balneolaceae bacterium ANBcel3]|nr:DUF4900 domain-containing protein [Balneolaceae bacterium ANBcel3]
MGKPLLITVGLLFMLFSLTMMNMRNREAMVSERLVSYYTEQHAMNIANSVAEHARRHIMANSDNNVDIPATDYMGTEVTLHVVNLGMFEKRITATSHYENKIAEAVIEMYRLPISEYAYFTNRETSDGGAPIWFHSADILYGPVHTNGTFNFMGTPTFEGRISSPNSPDYASGADPDFRQGSYFGADYENNSDQIPTIEYDNISDLRGAAALSSLKFEGNIELEFLGEDGIKIVRSDGEEDVRSLEELYTSEGDQVVISSDGEITIKGEVKGQYTVYSEKDIKIVGDVKYHDHPEDPSDEVEHENVLGIASESDVIVCKDAHTVNDGSDLHIHASIIALGNSFYVEDYAEGSQRGTLHLVGGLIQETRGAVGTMQSRTNRWGQTTTTYTGFDKDYQYDDRLGDNRIAPPFFPRAESYTTRSWLTTVREAPPISEPPL